MTLAEPPIREVAVAGGGIVGWSVAAALRRRLPTLRVTVLAAPPPPDAIAERVGSTLPSILGFHSDIGLGEGDTVMRARSGFRLGTMFDGWNAGLPAYVHAYGPHGRSFGTTSFHLQWARFAREGGAARFDAYSAAAALGRAGRFTADRAAPDPLLDEVEFGLTLDLPRYGQMMRAYALHLGAVERGGGIADLRLHGESGFIEALRLADGSEVAADLFVDCTGPAALLRSRLDDAFADWSRWLPADRIMFGEAPADPEPALLDRAAALAAGWRWRSPSLVRTAFGLAYASAGLGEPEAARALGEIRAQHIYAPVAIRQGRRERPWLRNCVALGDAAVSVEPLEWTNLHLVHSAIDRIVSMMPGRSCAPIELAEYNRQSEAEADRVRDLLVLHYAASSRREPFWRDAAAAEPPASLAHTLALFRERGRLPFYEEETFSRDSWLAVLLGQGLLPRRVDPLAEAVPPALARQEMARMREAIAALVAKVPTHGAYLRNLMRQAQV